MADLTAKRGERIKEQMQKEIINRLKETVEKEKINISEMCKECNITRNNYYKIIQGSFPRIDTALYIVRYLEKKTKKRIWLEHIWELKRESQAEDVTDMGNA